MPAPYSVALGEARPALLDALHGFQQVVGDMDDLMLLGPSRVHGWARVDCLVHVRVGLQELLAGIPAVTEVTPDVDAASYWSMWEAEAAQDPVPGILVTRRIASAYTRPTHAGEELRQVVGGLVRMVTAMSDGPVRFQGHTIAAGDLLATWAVEVAVHHHDLDAPDGAGPAPSAVRIGRRTAEALLGDAAGDGDDLAVMLRGFGRR